MLSPDLSPAPVVVTEDELRRYLRCASVLLVDVSEPLTAVERFHRLRRSRAWVEAVSLGLDQLMRDLEHELAVVDTVDEPLTRPIAPRRIEPSR